jgi:hypothetical protein
VTNYGQRETEDTANAVQTFFMEASISLAALKTTSDLAESICVPHALPTTEYNPGVDTPRVASQLSSVFAMNFGSNW